MADAWYRRTIWLFLFGIVHAYVRRPGIFYAYGADWGNSRSPSGNVAPGRLFALGAALLLAGAAFSAYDNAQVLKSHRHAIEAQAILDRGETPPADLQEGLDAWNEKRELMQPSRGGEGGLRGGDAGGVHLGDETAGGHDLLDALGFTTGPPFATPRPELDAPGDGPVQVAGVAGPGCPRGSTR